MGKGFGYDMNDFLSPNEGHDVEEGKRTGSGLSILTYNHTYYSPDAFIASLEENIKTKKPKRLVIDGLSVYELR
jgi:hypothetical protein